MKSRAGEGNANYRGGFEAKCEVCSKRVWVKPSRAHRERFFCSRACDAKWKSDNTQKGSHWRYAGPVQRECEKCGAGFEQSRKGFNQLPAKYCSNACRVEASRKRLTKACEVCLTEFTVRAYKEDARFCSRPCKRLSQIKVRTEVEIARKRLNGRMATLMRYSLKGKKNGRKWETLAGYTLADLMAHLESKFQPGMTWENMVEWHIDHIRPQCSFSYADASDPEFRQCWALSNLQPLWAVDNLRKGSKYQPAATA